MKSHGVEFSPSNFESDFVLEDLRVGGSKLKLVSQLSCCFLRQELLLHIVSLQPGIHVLMGIGDMLLG